MNDGHEMTNQREALLKAFKKTSVIKEIGPPPPTAGDVAREFTSTISEGLDGEIEKSQKLSQEFWGA